MTPRTDSDQDTKCLLKSDNSLVGTVLALGNSGLSALGTGTLGGGGSFFLMAWASVVLL